MDNSVFSSLKGRHKMITRNRKRMNKKTLRKDSSDDDYFPLTDSSSSSLLRILDEAEEEETDDIDADEIKYLLEDANKFINTDETDDTDETDETDNETDETDETDNETGNETEDTKNKEKNPVNKLDKDYILFHNTNTVNNSVDNVRYFKNLNEKEKILVLENEKTIRDLNRGRTPQRFKVLNLPIDISIKAQIIRRLDSLESLDETNSDYHKINEWLSTLLLVPFNSYRDLSITNNNNKDEIHSYLSNVKSKLDKSIYGHNTAKFQILQLITQWITNPGSKGQIIGLQGPMGNGKTTFVKEGICNAIDRAFVSITLGGASDSALLEGHSYTYEGSICGRIVKSLIETRCMNPIIYFDELDKVSECPNGRELIHKLIHLTDHSQNNEFTDLYFSGIKFDLSRALFIFSFNDERKINPILKDRMRIIKMPALKLDDKLIIAKNYLIPELCKDIGFSKDNININNDIVKHIILNYTKEEGVRTLKRCLETIISKINMLQFMTDVPFMIDNLTYPITIDYNNVSKLLEIERIKPNTMMYI